MPPVIHLVRHGQGLHNISSDYDLQDPALTPFGVDQAKALQISPFADQSRLSLIVASPLQRALQTAAEAFGPAITHSDPIVALPDAQETSDDPCDVGSDPADLQRLVAEQNLHVDLSLVKEGWNDKTPGTRYGPDAAALQARALSTRRFLRERAADLMRKGNDSPEIVLVSHGSFLHFLTGDWEGADGRQGTGWRNCEVRSYSFQSDVSAGAEDDARLVETEDRRRQRGLAQPAPSRAEQTELFQSAMRNWKAQGLQVTTEIGIA